MDLAAAEIGSGESGGCKMSTAALLLAQGIASKAWQVRMSLAGQERSCRVQDYLKYLASNKLSHERSKWLFAKKYFQAIVSTLMKKRADCINSHRQTAQLRLQRPAHFKLVTTL